MNGHYILWLTGLSGSGKSTIASALYKLLTNKYSVELIDGDEFRKKIHPDLDFSPKAIKLNNQKIISYCDKLLKSKNFIIIPVIAPFNSTRLLARKKFGTKYIEVYCKASLEVCIKRDTKGLYKKATNGEIENLIGFHENVPYEIPTSPDIIVDTEKLDKGQSVDKILNYLKKRKIYEAN